VHLSKLNTGRGR